MDNDLISRAALLKYTTRMTEYDESGCGVPVLVVRTDDIEKVQAVDAVEVVRCKDCKHTTRSKVSPEKIICCLTKMCGTVDPDYFCADGEREIDAEVEG